MFNNRVEAAAGGGQPVGGSDIDDRFHVEFFMFININIVSVAAASG